MNPSMKAVLAAYGETPMDAVTHHLHLVPQEVPVPGAGEVLLQIRSCAVGWVDLLMMSGQYQHMAAPPYTPGLEFAGDVAAIGPGVTQVAVGDRVLADGFQTGPRSSGAHQQWGGFATWALLPERAALPLPANLSYDQGVNLLGNFETAAHVLHHRAKLQEGETVLVLGATGSTGLAGVQLARSLGATVIAAGRSASKLNEVLRHGAHHVVATADESGGVARFRDTLKALTGGRGVDVVWDGVGGDTTLEAIRGMAFGGRLCIVGWAATPFVANGQGQRGAPRANQLPTNLIQMKGLSVLGCPAVIATRHDPTLRPARLRWVFEQVAGGNIRPHVGPAHPLSALALALTEKWESRHVGGCVVHP